MCEGSAISAPHARAAARDSVALSELALVGSLPLAIEQVRSANARRQSAARDESALGCRYRHCCCSRSSRTRRARRSGQLEGSGCASRRGAKASASASSWRTRWTRTSRAAGAGVGLEHVRRRLEAFGADGEAGSTRCASRACSAMPLTLPVRSRRRREAVVDREKRAPSGTTHVGALPGKQSTRRTRASRGRGECAKRLRGG